MTCVWGVTLQGIKALRVEVEVEMTGGLFSISIVGLPDAAVRESKERVRAALRSLGMALKGRIAVNLAPADLPKEGALLDLPIAVGMADSMGMVSLPSPALFLGELSLDGRVRRTRGAVPAALLAREMKIPLYVSEENAFEVGLVHGVKAYRVSDLNSLFGHLRGEAELPLIQKSAAREDDFKVDPDFVDIKGQAAAKRALEIAAAGHHNVLLIGSPGSGKTLLARALRGILPPLSDEELMETLLVRSTLGLPWKGSRQRPFRPIHHTSSTVAVCGGGNSLRPGELSLAHRGVLFLDEFTEFRRDMTEALRQPIEDGQIVISRANGSVQYPARVLLVLACNPCACGYRGDPVEPCRCSFSDLERYRRRLSGPIMDRIDLYVSVPRLTTGELLDLGDRRGESSAEIRKRVCCARRVQWERWKDLGFQCNAELSERVVRRRLDLSRDAREYLSRIAGTLKLTGRGLSRVLKVARTIADLQTEKETGISALAEALTYRNSEVLP